MGYSYGFHLVLVKPPKAVVQEAITFVEGDQTGDSPLDIYAQEIVDFCLKCNTEQDYATAKFYFPEFGEVESGGSGSYGCGDQNDGIRQTAAIIGDRFPDAVFAIHHYYWDMTHLTVYTFQGDKVFDVVVVDFENYQVGPYKMSIHIDFMSVAMDGNMSTFFNEDYGYQFDYDYETLYKMAGLPLPVRQYNISVTGTTQVQGIVLSSDPTSAQISSTTQELELSV